MDSNPFYVVSTSHLSQLDFTSQLFFPFSFFLFHSTFLFFPFHSQKNSHLVLKDRSKTQFHFIDSNLIPFCSYPFRYFTYFRGKDEKKVSFIHPIINFACNSGFCCRFYFLILFSFIKNQNHFFPLFCLWVFFFEVLGLVKSEIFSYSTPFWISILDLRLCWKYRIFFFYCFCN